MNKLLIPVVATAILGASAVWAFPGGGHHSGHHQKRITKMLDVVDATPAQRTAITGSLKAQKPAREALRQQSRELYRAFKGLDPTAGDYQQKVDAMAMRHGELSAERFRLKALSRQNIETQLTDDQRQKLAEFRQQSRAERHEKFRQRRESAAD